MKLDIGKRLQKDLLTKPKIILHTDKKPWFFSQY